ncbi:zinc finger protein 830 [Periophthalmus magnuspinnatus]|uniref:zinc finger protein 830 n=1 Tax=Periophthalmus magnuspinnatus TaxID=409849 RepID=UPI00145B44CC|nr:zinc finger protein 830 [Periophthalmus magnuspinnatus]
MATAKKGKKVVNQEELRRLMREKQRQASEKKRVESPFAQYNSLGHLSCVICDVQIKSHLLWTTHVLGKQHKEKVAELREAKQTPQSQGVKRKTTEQDEGSFKKPKPVHPASQSTLSTQSTSTLPTDFFQKPPKPAGASLLGGAYDDDEDEEKDEDEQSQPTNPQSAQTPGLPADFFDSSIPQSVPAISHSGSIQKAETPEKEKPEKKDKTAESLPEGFFDDPVTDAKVRNVEAPKDQMDKEWEEFQKEMRQVNTKSEAIVAEEDEEGRLERQIDEIDEQIECYRRVEVLRDKRDMVKGQTQRRKMEKMEVDVSVEEEEEEEDEEEELLGLLSHDWRAKRALS